MSWATPTSVARPRVVVGTAREGFGRAIEAETRTYTDANNSVETITQHARVGGLHPDTDYVFEVTGDGATYGRGDHPAPAISETARNDHGSRAGLPCRN